MTATSLLGTWVLAAIGLLFLLVFIGTGYRVFRRRRRLYYKRLARINHIVGWSRIVFVVLGLAAAVRVAWRGTNYQTFLIAPCAWAIVVLLGVVGTDFFLFGRSRYSSVARTKVRISVCLPWILVVLLLLLLTIGWSGVNWGRETAAIDQRSHVYSWVLDGAFGWGSRSPYPGTFYTTPLLYCIPAVLVVGVAGIILVLIRPAWLPAKKYAALDEGFRSRTIRDIVMICVGAVSAVLTMMGLDIAWAFSTLGPGSNERALVVAVAFFIGAWSLGQSFWVLANLIFLPPVTEDQHLAEQIRALATVRVEYVSVPHQGEVVDLTIPQIGGTGGETIEIGEGETIQVGGTGAPSESTGSGASGPEETVPTVETIPESGVPEESVVSEASVSGEQVAAETGTKPVPAANEPVKHFTTKPSATHRPGFKAKKKKSRRR